MTVTKDLVEIRGLQLLLTRHGISGSKGETVILADADPNNLQEFIDDLRDKIKGKSVE